MHSNHLHLEHKQQEDAIVNKKYDNGDYVGTMKNGMMHKGTLTFTNGTIYTGEFKNNLEHGQGETKYYNGNNYKGEYRNGQRNGVGTMKYTDGSIYMGEWVHDNRNGHGIRVYADGGVYNGNWVDDLRNGQGELRYADGAIYIGGWLNGKRNGVGTMTYANGDIYRGSWKDDKMHGVGTMAYVNGDTYRGGDWKDDKMHGVGTITYANGDTYLGQWIDGKRIGIGTMTYTNGEKYIGNWGVSPYFYDVEYDPPFNVEQANRSGLPNGQGVYYTRDYSLKGNWVNGLAHGYFVKRTPTNVKIRRPNGIHQIATFETRLFNKGIQGREVKIELGDGMTTGIQDRPDDKECDICTESLQSKPVFWLSDCHHAFHQQCLFHNVELHGKQTCLFQCNEPITGLKNYYSIKRPDGFRWAGKRSSKNKNKSSKKIRINHRKK